MSSPAKSLITIFSARTGWFITTMVNSAAYITILIGYLLGIFNAYPLTILNFLAFTACQLLIVIFLWLLINKYEVQRQVLPCVGLLSVLTIISGFLGRTGIYWDWLLYMVMISVYVYSLSFRAALVSSVLLYGIACINLDFMNHWRGLDIATCLQILSGMVFVAAFSVSFQLLRLQNERSKHLLHQLERSNSELELAHKQLQKYASEVEELTIVRERARLAREIHDTLGHYLVVLSIQLETVSKLYERDPAQTAIEITEARRVAAQSMQEVRNAVAALRPSSIATIGLTEALRQLGSEFERTSGETELTLDLDTQMPAISPHIQIALYRAAQEALTNVRKHARAAKVLVRLRYEDAELKLVVLDNGIGYSSSDINKRRGGFGLIGLRERIDLLNGRVEYGPAEPTGYRVTIKIPVPHEISPSLLTSEASKELEDKSYEPAHSRADC